MERTVNTDLEKALRAACEAARSRPHHADLLAKLAAAAPDYHFVHRMSCGGWFRPGGVVTARGERISSDLTSWAEAAGEAADEDGARLLAACTGRPEEEDLRFDIGLPPEADAPLVTHHAGITHYFTVQYGDAPEAFLQVEIEELREVVSHRLSEIEAPDSVEDLISPSKGHADGRPIKPAIYRLRRINDIARVLTRLTLQQNGVVAPAVRFVSDWSRSLGASELLNDHWVMEISSWQDRFGVERIGLKPLPLNEHLRPPVPEEGSGADLGRALIDYDRRAGYRLAWFFDMVSGRGVPSSLAAQVGDHWEAGFRYLPERHARCVLDFLRAPYRI
jgi:hypothetical protein